MAKELIISANVHEKKVAMLEDGVVTEFYVERRDENQGVVGNLYKGRVMKVLPGMQSAFVDIGLERDAFLYVSDFTEFMEEEEEIDFREVTEDARAAGHRVDDRSRRPERPRFEPQPVSARPAVEHPGESAPAERPVRIEDAVEQLAEIAVESVIPPPPPEEDLPPQETEEVSPSSEAIRIERITDEGEPFEATQPEQPADAEAAEAEAKPKRGRGRKPVEPKKKTAAEPKVARGAARKPPQPRRRREEESEGNAVAQAESAAHFERVTDEDVAQDAGDLLKDALVQEKIIDQVHHAEFQTTSSQPEPETEWRVGSLRSLTEGESNFQRVVDENAEARRNEELSTGGGSESENIGREQQGENKGSPFRHISDVVRGLYGRIQSGSSGESSDEPGERESRESGLKREPSAVESSTENNGKSSEDDDRDAEVRDRGPRAEFAVRRGGRGRRGRGGRREPAAGGPAGAPPGYERSNVAGEARGAVKEPAPEEEPPSDSTPPVEARPIESKASDERPEPRALEPRAPDPRPQRRPDPRRSDSRSPDQRSPDLRRPETGAGRRPERSGPPTISDLLHEGQEILVQIAKEPIAKKGARITSHIALPGRLIVYMPTVNHIGVSRKIPNEAERIRLKRIVQTIRAEEDIPSGGFIVRTAGVGISEKELRDDVRYLVRTWLDIRSGAEKAKAPALVHRDLDLVQRLLRDQLSDDFESIRVDSEEEYQGIVEFVNRIQPRLVRRVKLYTKDQPILEAYGVQVEIDKAIKPRVWLKSGGYLVINQTEALVAIDVNTGKFVGRGSGRLEDTITRTNLEAVDEIVRQIRLRDLGGIIVLDLIDMEERRNRQKVMQALQEALRNDKSPTKVLSFNDFGLVIMTRKRVKQSLERTLCSPCQYCQGAGLIKSPQTICYELLEEARRLAKGINGDKDNKQVTLRINPDVAKALRSSERDVMVEIEDYLGPIDITSDPTIHQEQYDFAVT